MADVVTPAARSRMMAGIKGKNTKPELLIRRALHRMGFRYKLHDPQLPGRPDLVLKKFRSVIFVHGCFWHGHECHLFKWPKSREEFWREKIKSNGRSDSRTISKLMAKGWRVAIIWECSIKGRKGKPVETVVKMVSDWLVGELPFLEIEGFNE